MGAWSVSITGNDTAQDLLSEYQAAFYYNDVDTALKKIDDYARKVLDASDYEWCDYYYSLADYMWRKGILTEEVKNEAIRLIDSGFGLYIFEETDIKTLEKRKAVLQQFRDKITSQQPPKKKITVNLYTKPIFEIGDIVAFQLQTLDKFYTGKCKVNENEFRQLHGKYVAVRKVKDHVSYKSSIEPALSDIWPVFQLYNKIFDKIPSLTDVINCGFVDLIDNMKTLDGSFTCEGSMFYFKKRKYIILGNHQKGIEEKKDYGQEKEKKSYCKQSIFIFFSINKPSVNADETIIDSISI